MNEDRKKSKFKTITEVFEPKNSKQVKHFVAEIQRLAKFPKNIRSQWGKLRQLPKKIYKDIETHKDKKKSTKAKKTCKNPPISTIFSVRQNYHDKIFWTPLFCKKKLNKKAKPIAHVGQKELECVYSRKFIIGLGYSACYVLFFGRKGTVNADYQSAHLVTTFVKADLSKQKIHPSEKPLVGQIMALWHNKPVWTSEREKQMKSLTFFDRHQVFNPMLGKTFQKIKIGLL